MTWRRGDSACWLSTKVRPRAQRCVQLSPNVLLLTTAYTDMGAPTRAGWYVQRLYGGELSRCPVWRCVQLMLPPRRLEAAAGECHKTQNVDLQLLIANCERCSLSVGELVAQETHPTRLVSQRRPQPGHCAAPPLLGAPSPPQAALEALQLDLAHHRSVLVAKKRELESTSLSTSAGMMSEWAAHPW